MCNSNFVVMRGLRQGQVDHLWDKVQKWDECVKTRTSVSIAILAASYSPVSHYMIQTFCLLSTDNRLLGKP